MRDLQAAHDAWERDTWEESAAYIADRLADGTGHRVNVPDPLPGQDPALDAWMAFFPWHGYPAAALHVPVDGDWKLSFALTDAPPEDASDVLVDLVIGQYLATVG